MKKNVHCNLVAVPVVENTRIGALVANFSDIERFVGRKQHRLYRCCICRCRIHDVNFGSIAVAIDEARIIVDPN